MSQYLVRRLKQTDKIELLINSEISKMQGNDVLRSVEIRNNKTHQTKIVETSAVFIFIGAIPRTDWLPSQIEVDDKGFVKTGPQVASNAWFAGRQPFLLETSRPGIFAAGDVRLGSIKRVASAVGEGSMAVQFVHQILDKL